MATSVVTLQRYVRGWIARKNFDIIREKTLEEKAKKENQLPKQVTDKDRELTTQQLSDLSRKEMEEFQIPWGNVKMRRKMFSAVNNQDEAATIIQSRKYLYYYVLVNGYPNKSYFNAIRL